MRKIKSHQNKFTVVLVACLFVSTASFAQFGNRMKNGLNFYLDSQDSSHFIRLNMVSQIWARYTENNPLTQVNGYNQAYTSDVILRRARLILSGQFTDRISFFTQF